MKNNFENIKAKMELILDVGQVLMENGSTTDKIVPRLEKVAEFLKIPAKNFYLTVSPSILFLRISDDEKTNVSFRNCPKHAINMNVLDLTNRLISNAIEKNYSPERFRQILEKIFNKNGLYSQIQIILATGFACSGLSILFGGDIFSAMFTAICAMIGKVLQLKLLKLGANEFISIVLTAFVTTFFAHFSEILPTKTIWTPIIACSLFLIPSVPFVHSILEILNNFLLRGMTLLFRAILIVGSMTVGISIALEICAKISNKTFTILRFAPDHNFFVIAVAAAATAIGFSIILNTSKKFFLTIGIFAATAVLSRNFFYEVGFTTEFSTFLGATLISLISIKISKVLNASMNIFVIPSIIPLFPGVMVYRFLISCLDLENLSVEEFYSSLYVGIDAMQIIFAMAIGATLPNLLAKKFLKKK